MLIDDGAVTVWIPEEFLDESTYSFTVGPARELSVSPYGLHPATDIEAAVASRWADGKAAVASIDPAASVQDSVESTAVAGFPAALGFVTVVGANFRMHRGLCIVRMDGEHGLEIEHEVEGAAASDPPALEAFFRRVLASAWPLTSTTSPAVPPGHNARLLGRIGIVLPSDAVARGDYRFQSPRTPTRFALLPGRMPPRRYPIGYFAKEDTLFVEDSKSVEVVPNGGAVRGTEWVERVRRERPALEVGTKTLSPDLTDVHHVRLAELAPAAAGDRADAPFVSVLAAAPQDSAAELDALWARVLATVRT